MQVSTIHQSGIHPKKTIHQSGIHLKKTWVFIQRMDGSHSKNLKMNLQISGSRDRQCRGSRAALPHWMQSHYRGHRGQRRLALRPGWGYHIYITMCVYIYIYTLHDMCIYINEIMHIYMKWSYYIYRVTDNHLERKIFSNFFSYLERSKISSLRT